MRFATQVFLAVAAVSSASVLTGSTLVYVSAEHTIHDQYQYHYRELTSAVARDFASLEVAYDQLGSNAAQSVRERILNSRGLPTKSELEQLAKDLGVGEIRLVKFDGRDFHPEENRFETDAKNTGSISKVLSLQAYDQKYQIQVSIRFSEMGKLLQELVEDESDVVHILIRTASGKTIAEMSHESSMREVHPEAEQMVIHSAGDSGGYDFVATISQKTLQQSLQALRVRFAIIFLCLLMLALGFSFWISRRLSRRIGEVQKAMDEQIEEKSGQLAPLPISSHQDEIDSLVSHFNRMREANRDAQKSIARAEVAAQVAHDIRSPLTGMMLAFQQLRDRLSSGKDSQDTAILDLMSVLSTGISRVNGIVDRIAGKKKDSHDLVPVETPRLTLVDKLLRDVANEHAIRNASSKKFVVSGFQDIPKFWAVIQVTELQTALSNLLNNAFEASPPGGNVELKLSEEKDHLLVSVKDEGTGIPEEMMKRVFEREFTSGKTGGSGLGLYQAKKAVEWGGGQITIVSQKGVGTEVRFTVPTEHEPAWIAHELHMPTSAKLLVVDDDPLILSQWRTKAKEAGISIQKVTSFSELETLWPNLDTHSMRFIFDQYAQAGGTGLDFIERHALGTLNGGNRVFLSTSEYDDPTIQARLKKAKSRLIPKVQLQSFRIILESAVKSGEN